MRTPQPIDRDRLQQLLADSAQLVEVLPADQFRWAHLPQAVNLPLKELEDHLDDLDRDRPVIVYCHDTLCDMSPRAAWRLHAAGYAEVHDYVAGKTDWLASDLPFEGDAQLVGAFARRAVPVVSVGQSVAVAAASHDEAGFGPVVVVNDAGVVMGVARQEALRAADPDTPVERVADLGISTVRPSEEVADLTVRMRELDTTRVVVTRLDGVLVGLFCSDDVQVGS